MTVRPSVPTSMRATLQASLSSRAQLSARPLFIVCTIAASFCATAMGQSSGQTSGQTALDRAIIAAAAPLTDAQKAAVSTFAASALEAIRDGTDATEMVDARWTLVTPARDPAATAPFRKGYSAILITELTPVIKGKDLQRAVNAMQVIRFTRTPESVDVLIERSNAATEPDAGKRLAAASILADSFEDLDASNAYLETAARRLRDAASTEPDWIALQQKLAAISTAAKRKDLPPDNARNIRKAQAEAVAAVAKSIKSNTTADERMQALQRALIGVRNELLLLQQADRTAASKTLAPAMGDLLTASSAQWAAGHAGGSSSGSRGVEVNPALAPSYAAVVNSCEVMLRLIDRAERPQAYANAKPDADARVLANAWDAGDKAKFDAEVKRWNAIVSAPPYK